MGARASRPLSYNPGEARILTLTLNFQPKKRAGRPRSHKTIHAFALE